MQACNEALVYLVSLTGMDGRQEEHVMAHYPTLADIPPWAVRVDVALPVTMLRYATLDDDYAERMKRLGDGVKLAMQAPSELSIV